MTHATVSVSHGNPNALSTLIRSTPMREPFMNTTHPDVFDESPPDAALIQTALCYLMTRYTLRPCFGLICTIVHHLQMLLAHPDLASLPERQKIYYGLLQDWSRIAERAQAVCCKGAAHQQGAIH